MEESYHMKSLKRFANFVLTFCVLASAQQAYALPVSSFATAQSNWQGSKYYSETTNDGKLSCKMDYAVYDTAGPKNAAENTFINSIGSVMPNMARYLYVYQVFNDQADSEASIAYLAIFSLQHSEMDVVSENISAKDDSAGGVAPSGTPPGGYIADGGTKVVWNFAGSLLVEGDHSWYLVLSSASGPTAGDYEAGTYDSDFPSPIPEPTIFALLSTGAMMIAGRRKRQ